MRQVMQQVWAMNKAGSKKPVYIHGWVSDEVFDA